MPRIISQVAGPGWFLEFSKALCRKAKFSVSGSEVTQYFFQMLRCLGKLTGQFWHNATLLQ